jgi:hypothetical protein
MLVIDGPMKGQLVEADRMPVVYEDQETGQLQSYWLQSWTLLGRVVNVLSVHPTSAGADLADLWELLISDDAKAAASF